MTKITHEQKPLDLSVVIPTMNHAHLTLQCLASLANTAEGLRYEVIIVDNGSTDATINLIGTHTPGQLRGKAQGETPPRRMTLLHNTSPRHLPKSWNMGAQAAQGRHILITNNDVLFAPGALRRLISAADENPQAGIVFPSGPGDLRSLLPSVADVEGAAPVQAIAGNLASMQAWQARRKAAEGKQATCYIDDPYVPQGGFCFLLTRQCLERIGGFDEATFQITGEDWDYFHRARRHFKLLRASDAYVHHLEHQTIKHAGQQYHEELCRSRFRLTEKREGVMELFSVVIPTFNRVDSLRVAIKSVIAQSFPHWRLYVIDDGSDNWDEVSLMAREFGPEAGRIWFFHRPKNVGAAACRNYGLSRTEGKYVAFLDSDDLWYPQHLARHFQAHETRDGAMVYSDPDFAWARWDAPSRRFLYTPDKHPLITYFGPFDRERLRQGNYIQTSGVSVWGDLARSLRFEFPQGRVTDEDWEYFKAVADAGGEGRPVVHLPEKTCRYHHALNTHEAQHLILGSVPGLAAGTEENKPAQVVLTPKNIALPQALALVGVCIATKNRAGLLKNALRSIPPAVPVCVCDDASTEWESVLQVAGEAASESLTLLRFDSSRGASAARNEAVRHLETEWVQFLDDDDLLAADWQGHLPAAFTEGADAVHFDAWVPAPDGIGLVQSADVFTSQVCVRREAFLDVGGFNESVSWAEERDLISRLEKAGKRVVHLPLPLVTRPKRGGSGDPQTARGEVGRMPEQENLHGTGPRRFHHGF